MNTLKSFITISIFLPYHQFILPRLVLPVYIVFSSQFWQTFFSLIHLVGLTYFSFLLCFYSQTLHSKYPRLTSCDIFNISCFSCQRVHQERVKSWFNHVERLWLACKCLPSISKYWRHRILTNIWWLLYP